MIPSGIAQCLNQLRHREPLRQHSTGCSTHYRTRHFFNNFTTNEDVVTKFEAGLPNCVRNVKVKNVLLFKFRCNIFIGVRIIKEMPGSVASGTPCSSGHLIHTCYIYKKGRYRILEW